MNYRHAFHAGNFADVLKHVILVRVLLYLQRKDTPFRFIDTHAGAGAYDLDSEAARRSPEWRDGVARLLRAKPPEAVANLLKPYIDALGEIDPAESRPLRSPGAPAIAQSLLRAQDRMTLCEKHREERELLVAAMGRDRRLHISGDDGYVLLNAQTPPVERRGLVLVDPPYEETDEATRVEKAMATALRKWPRGVYMLWRPIKDEAEDVRFLTVMAGLGVPNMLRLEIDVGPIPPGPHSPAPLRRTGLLIVNPPFGLFDEAKILMPWLAKLLTRAGQGAAVVNWLTPPT